MKFVYAIIATTLLGCFPNHPTMTQKPALDISPWSDHIARSPATGNIYRYMKLDGPSTDAPAILLLHGGIFDNRIWLYMNDLQAHFTVVALEMPDNNLFYTGNVADQGKIVDDFVATLDYKELVVAGISAGAYAAIDYVSKAKDDRITSLILISTVMFAISEEEIKKRGRISNFALGLAPDKMRGIVENRASKKEYDAAPGNIQQRDIFYVRPYPYYYQLFRISYNQGNRPQDTNGITCPVLILHGEDDQIMPLHAAKLTPSVFPDAEFQSFPNYGHAMVFSHGPQITSAITDFLTRKNLVK